MRYSLHCLTLALSILVIAAGCSSEPKSFEEEIRQAYQNERGFFYLKIPPAILSMLLKLSDDQEMIEFFGNARQVGIISFGEGFPVSENPELVKRLEQMLTKYEYEDMVRISDQDRLISMKVKETGGKASELVTIISQGEGPVTAITLSGEINLQTLVRLAAELDFDKLMQMKEMGRR